MDHTPSSSAPSFPFKVERMVDMISSILKVELEIRLRFSITDG